MIAKSFLYRNFLLESETPFINNAYSNSIRVHFIGIKFLAPLTFIRTATNVTADCLHFKKSPNMGKLLEKRLHSYVKAQMRNGHFSKGLWTQMSFDQIFFFHSDSVC